MEKNIQQISYELDLQGYQLSEILDFLTIHIGYETHLTEEHIRTMIDAEDIIANVYAQRPMKKYTLDELAQIDIDAREIFEGQHYDECK